MHIFFSRLEKSFSQQIERITFILNAVESKKLSSMHKHTAFNKFDGLHRKFARLISFMRSYSDREKQKKTTTIYLYVYFDQKKTSLMPARIKKKRYNKSSDKQK